MAGMTAWVFAAALGAAFGGSATAAEKITYLLPAPPSLPAFAPWVLAKHLGYYTQAGYEVDFVVARGGVDVAKQIGVGNALIGGAIGDTPIIVRGNGVPVKAVGLMGGGALTVVVGRKDRGIEKIEDLRGKKISVLAFQDTTYYALLGALASKGITKNDVNAQAAGPAAVASLVVAGTVDACACTPDWEINVKDGVPDVVSLPTKDHFQSMSQAILASDKMIAERPDMVRAHRQGDAARHAIRHGRSGQGRAGLCRGFPDVQGQGRADEAASSRTTPSAPTRARARSARWMRSGSPTCSASTSSRALSTPSCRSSSSTATTSSGSPPCPGRARSGAKAGTQDHATFQ